MRREGSPSARLRWILGTYAIVFFGGGCKHGYDILAAGFLPASPFPQVLQLYWDSLFFFDLLTVALIFSHRRSGVLLAIAVMTTDVIANVYAEYLRQAPWLNNLIGNSPFILFAIFVCATARLLLRDASPPGASIVRKPDMA